MVNPDIVCPQLAKLSMEALGHLRAVWEDNSDMTYLIDMELAARLPTLELIMSLLKGRRFDLHNEKALQNQIEQVLRLADIPPGREHRLSDDSIIDFLAISIGIEVKIKGTPKEIFKQCQRYCEFEQVQQLLLVTNKQIMLPAELNGKPTRTFNLGLAWL